MPIEYVCSRLLPENKGERIEALCIWRLTEERPLIATKGLQRFVDRFLKETSCKELQGNPPSPPSSYPGISIGFPNAKLFSGDFRLGGPLTPPPFSREELFKPEWIPLLKGLDSGAATYFSPSKDPAVAEEMPLCPEIQASFPK